MFVSSTTRVGGRLKVAVRCRLAGWSAAPAVEGAAFTITPVRTSVFCAGLGVGYVWHWLSKGRREESSGAGWCSQLTWGTQEQPVHLLLLNLQQLKHYSRRSAHPPAS